MKINYKFRSHYRIKITTWILLLCGIAINTKAQVVITNTNFSMGTTGRIGVGLSPNGEGNNWKPLNLSGQGSLGGRMEQVDYV
ncbi:MAG: hypothetical protein B7Y83_13165, partial [Flavobacteriales bacterium 32-34-25]